MLRGPMGQQVMAKPGGKLLPVWSEAGEPERYRLLDCFDQSLRQAGKGR